MANFPSRVTHRQIFDLHLVLEGFRSLRLTGSREGP